MSIFGTKRGFVGGRRGIELRLDRGEAQVLGHLLEQLDALVGPGAERPTSDDPLAQLLGPEDADRPQDPAVLRLFPDGYLDDDEASQEFRRFTQSGLRQQKSERLQRAQAVLSQFAETDGGDEDRVVAVAVDADDADAFLGTLNDLRLVLGVRLGIVADDQDVAEEWAEDDPRQATYGAYQWLTWLQAGLLDAMH